MLHMLRTISWTHGMNSMILMLLVYQQTQYRTVRDIFYSTSELYITRHSSWEGKDRKGETSRAVWTCAMNDLYITNYWKYPNHLTWQRKTLRLTFRLQDLYTVCLKGKLLSSSLIRSWEHIHSRGYVVPSTLLKYFIFKHVWGYFEVAK